MMSVRRMKHDLRTKARFPIFHGSVASSYEQYYGDKVDLLGNGTLSWSPRAAGDAAL